MKKIFLLLICVLCGISMFAQNDVTKFLGFPVDGSKSEMIKNLKSKGFTTFTVGDNEGSKGRFNGVEVNVYISTENGKVSRILVCDANHVGESDIKIRFNTLCRQFMDNGKYFSAEDYTIADDENISYQMAVNAKRYEAIFYQMPEGKALEDLKASILQETAAKYTPTQLENPSDELKAEITINSMKQLFKAVEKKTVWFMISEDYGKYYISMFYDNEYNRPNGEDL